MINQDLFSQGRFLAVVAVLIVGIIVAVVAVEPLKQSVYALSASKPVVRMTTSGSNLYAAWWANVNGDWEIVFRASDDNGATFGDPINLSNSPGSISDRVAMQASGDNIYISWWETNNQTGTEEPIFRVSSDNGATFGAAQGLSADTIESESSIGPEEEADEEG